MEAATRQHEWTKYLRFFNEQNAGRLTRLGVFEQNDDVVTDYWLESGLPLSGIDLDAKGERPSVQITLGNFTHNVNDAVRLVFQLNNAGDEDGVDIVGAEGKTTILRFESRTEVHDQIV